MAVFEDTANGTRYNISRVIVTYQSKRCSREETTDVGHLHLCAQHAELAVKGLIDQDGNCASVAERRDVSRYPKKYPRGLFHWAQELKK